MFRAYDIGARHSVETYSLKTIMITILDLPSELIASVLPFLDKEDIFSFRLTSRSLERSALSYFGTRFFHKKGYLITTPSLNVIKSIARHVDLRKYVHHIWFNPDLWTFMLWEDITRYGGSYGERKKNKKALIRCLKDHDDLLKNNGLQFYLKDVLCRLPNLVAIGMRRSEDHAPWGWEELEKITGYDPRSLGTIPSIPLHDLSGPTLLFNNIISAMAATGKSVKRLYTDAVEIDNIRPDLLPQQNLDKACRSLLYLELNASRGLLEEPEHDEHVSLEDERDYGTNLLKLFRVVPQLRELGLQIFPDRKQSHLVPPSYRDPESWRKSYPYITFQKLATNVQLSHLERIKLEKITTTPETLKTFLEPSQSCLRSLKIRDIRLLSSENNEKPWRTMFSFLRTSCTRLSYILLYHLMYEAGGISFVENPPTPVPYVETIDGNGAPNPPYSQPAGDEFFTKYDHIALEAGTREEVVAKLDQIVDSHWYQKPIFSYEMDEALWHTDTSDEEL